MKIKHRLFFYNVLITLISTLLILFIFNYVNKNISNTFYNVSSITVDENVSKVRKILLMNKTYQIMDINLKKYNYKLYIYENKVQIYGNKNSSLDELVERYHGPKNNIRTIFIDNTTAVMKIDENKIYFAIHEKYFKGDMPPFFPKANNPFKQLFIKISIIILISLGIVLIFAIIFSNKILKMVMTPVKLLKSGAERVQDGNFEEPINYNMEDEFSSVIDNFNEMQKSLKDSANKAKHYEEAKKEMINGISHDIRTPLTVVKGNIKGIQDGIASTKEKRNQYLEIAYNRATDIENLLNRLFDAFDYEMSEIKLNKQLVNVKDYITEIINTNENVINKTIQIDINSIGDEINFYLDKIQFKRVFDNLINNSIQHNKENKNLKIKINLRMEKDSLKISFNDNGKGVKEENLNKIFTEFFKEDQSRNYNKHSSGLGLFIVKRIVESHNGTIVAKNKKGLLFEITLKGDNHIE